MKLPTHLTRQMQVLQEELVSIQRKLDEAITTPTDLWEAESYQDMVERCHYAHMKLIITALIYPTPAQIIALKPKVNAFNEKYGTCRASIMKIRKKLEENSKLIVLEEISPQLFNEETKEEVSTKPTVRLTTFGCTTEDNLSEFQSGIHAPTPSPPSDHSRLSIQQQFWGAQDPPEIPIYSPPQQMQQQAYVPDEQKTELEEEQELMAIISDIADRATSIKAKNVCISDPPAHTAPAAAMVKPVNQTRSQLRPAPEDPRAPPAAPVALAPPEGLPPP